MQHTIFFNLYILVIVLVYCEFFVQSFVVLSFKV